MQSTTFHQSAHLSDGELDMPVIECPFCSSSSRTKVLALQQDPQVDLLACHNCWALSASRMPTPYALEAYYAKYYDGRDEKITLDSPARIASHILIHSRILERNLTNREMSVLDYGGGDGAIAVRIAAKLKAAGAGRVDIHVVDYDQSGVNGVVNGVSIFRHRDLATLPDKKFDLVVASAVLEHIPAPKEILRTLFKLMKTSGVFYARTPYVAPLIRIAARFNIRIDFTFPAHVHDLGSKFWKSIIKILQLDGEYRVIRSTPSIVETTFSSNFLRTLIAVLLKLPGYIFKDSYHLVGGWEVFVVRDA